MRTVTPAKHDVNQDLFIYFSSKPTMALAVKRMSNKEVRGKTNSRLFQ